MNELMIIVEIVLQNSQNAHQKYFRENIFGYIYYNHILLLNVVIVSNIL